MAEAKSFDLACFFICQMNIKLHKMTEENLTGRQCKQYKGLKMKMTVQTF